MRKFIARVIVFIILLISYFGINMAVNRYIYLNQALPIKDKKVLIAGDSHTQKSLNPEYFPSAQNISQVTEPYVITYWKLERIFKSFIPDVLILGFAPHNISRFNDIKFSNVQWSGEMFKRYYPIEEFHDVSREISIDFTAFYKVLWKQTAFYPKSNHINYLGKYTNTEKSNIRNWKLTAERHFFEAGKPMNVSQFSIDYLDSIVSLCKAKNVTLVLVSNPVYDKYLKRIPSKFTRRYMKLAKRFGKDNLVFDKTRESYPDSLYLNADHLNENGARRFTSELIKFLGNKIETDNIVYKQ